MSEVVLTRVSKHYGNVAAVREFSFTVQQGEFVALLGPSGCGKTTTLRMIAGFIPVTSGRITIGAKDVTHVPPHRRNTGMVFQGYALFPHMTVAQNVAFGLEMRKVSKAEATPRVEEALRLVRLEGYGERYPRQLSGGQQQRVALARALVVQPDVFLLDEPLSNLDAKLRHDVRIEIRQLQRKLGLTTVFVTHDQEEALTVADRLIVMNKGEIEQIGTPEELYNRPRTHFVADFLGKSNFFSGRLEGEGIFRTKGGTALRFLGAAIPSASLVAVRPEKLRLVPVGSTVDTANSVRGRVELVTFLGAIIETIVRLESGETVTVHSQNQTIDRHYPVGSDVLVTWGADANLILEEPAPQPA